MEYKKKRGTLETVLVVVIAILIILIAIVSALLFVRPLLQNRGGKMVIDRKLKLGNRYLSEMDYENAVTEFSDVIEIDEKNTDAYIGLADAYSGLGKWSAAVDNYDTGLDTVREKAGIVTVASLENGGDTGGGNVEGGSSDADTASLWVRSGLVRADVLAEAGLPDDEYMTDDDLYLIAVMTYPEDVFADLYEDEPYVLDDIDLTVGDIYEVIDRRNDAIAEDLEEIRAANGDAGKYLDYINWVEANGSDADDGSGESAVQGTEDTEITETDKEDKDEQESKIDWFGYIEENFVDDLGCVSLDQASKSIGENWNYPSTWDVRTGVISAQVVDLNDDGRDECAVYFFDDRFAYSADNTSMSTDPATTLYIALLTSDDSGQISQVGQRQIFFDNSIGFTDGVSGIIRFGGKKYIYTELNSNAYYANGYDALYIFFAYDGQSFLPAFAVGKTGGGSTDFEYSIIARDENGSFTGQDVADSGWYTADGSYSKRILCVEGQWGHYHQLSDYDTSLMLDVFNPEQAMALGLETVTGKTPDVVTLENADNGYAFGDQYYTYRNSKIFTQAFHYNCSGASAGSGARNMTITLEDYTGFWTLAQSKR